MKKILVSAAVAAFAFSSSTYAAEDMFYVKANVGWDKPNKIKSLKSESNVFFGLGGGYYVMDNVRAELAYDHYLEPEFKGTLNNRADTKLKSRADSVLLNGFVDLFDISVAKVFAGAGLGMSMISADLSFPNKAGDQKLKRKNNFAFAGYVGTSVEFAPGINGELTYSYRDLGSLKKAQSGAISGNIKGHHVTAGIRFDI